MVTMKGSAEASSQQPEAAANMATAAQSMQFELHAEKLNWTMMLIMRITSAGLLLTAISFGATRLVFNIHAQTLFGREVDIELQLALLGLINKVMDLLVTMSLEDLAAVVLTLWMVGDRCGRGELGVRLMDFELSQELTKPWASIASFWKRCRVLGWSGTGYLGLVRLAVTLAVSICVFLQGVAVNTIGMPKERWYPQNEQTYPFLDFHGVDVSYWWAGFEVVDSGAVSWDAAKIYSASIAFSSLRMLATGFEQSNHGWQQIGGSATDENIVALNTRLDGNTVRGVAIQNSNAQNVFDWIHVHGPRPARNAIGWNANIILVVPSVAVSCGQANETFDNRTVAIRENGQSPSSFIVDINATQDQATDTTACTVNFSRALFPVNVWITEHSATSMSVNKYGQAYNQTLSTLAFEQVDSNITQNLYAQIGVVVGIFEGMVPNVNAAQLLRRNARRIRSLRPDIESDTDALAAVVAMLSTQLLSYGVWNVTLSPDADAMLVARGIKWQVYGSSPRLNWQWITIIVLATLLSVVVAGILQSLVHRVSPTKILKPGPMLIAANLSDDLQTLRSSTSADDKAIESARFLVRDVDNGRVTICDEAEKGKKVHSRKSYAWRR